MWPIVIIIHPPPIRNMSQLINTQKQLSIEQFISEPAVERFDIAILAKTARSNIQCLYTRFSEPFLHDLRDKLVEVTNDCIKV